MANTTIPSELIADGAITSAKLDTNIAVGGTLNVSGAFTSLGIDDNADATAITIDSSENVGIGTSSITNNTLGKTTYFGNSTSSITGDSSNARFWLGNNWYYNSGDKFIGTGYANLYTQQSGNHEFLTSTASGTAGAAATFTSVLKIDSSGNVLVGHTSLNGTGGVDIGTSGYIRASRSGDEAAIFNRETNDGTIAVFSKDGTTVGTINSWSQTGSSRISMVNPNGNGLGIFRESSTFASIVPITNGASGNGAHGLGRADYRWKDLYLSGGVYLGGTGAANKH
jgi:hypothetical protein